MTAPRTRFDKRYSLPGIDTTAVDSIAENMRESYAGISEAAGQFAEKFSALKAQEAKARSMVPDADFTADAAPNSVFATKADKINQRINGDAEDSYNFLNPADVERFNSDVAGLKKEMEEFEPTYDAAIKNIQKLVVEHDIFQKVGYDPKQAITESANGNDYYNAKAGPEAFEETMKMVDALRYGSSKEDPTTGKISLFDQSGNQVAEYGSPQEYLQAIVELGKPDLTPVPVDNGADLAIQKNWAGQFKTRKDAESAALRFVIENPQLAERRAREVMGVPELAPQGVMSDEAKALLEKHPEANVDFISDAQLAFWDEFMQGWDQTHVPASSSKSDKTAQKLKQAENDFYQSIRVVNKKSRTPIFEDFTNQGLPLPTGMEEVDEGTEIMIPLQGIKNNMIVEVEGEKGFFRPQELRVVDGIYQLTGAFAVDRMQSGTSVQQVTPETITLDPSKVEDVQVIQQLERLGRQDLFGVSLQGIIENPSSIGARVDNMLVEPSSFDSSTEEVSEFPADGF